MSRWFVGFNKAGQLPEAEPLEVHSFEYGRELLLAMLSEASECATEAGEYDEAEALENAIQDVLQLRDSRDLGLPITQHTYWLARDEQAFIQPLADAALARRLATSGSPILAKSET